MMMTTLKGWIYFIKKKSSCNWVDLIQIPIKLQSPKISSHHRTTNSRIIIIMCASVCGGDNLMNTNIWMSSLLLSVVLHTVVCQTLFVHTVLILCTHTHTTRAHNDWCHNSAQWNSRSLFAMFHVAMWSTHKSSLVTRLTHSLYTLHQLRKTFASIIL
jgi:hypothetical protein